MGDGSGRVASQEKKEIPFFFPAREKKVSYVLPVPGQSWDNPLKILFIRLWYVKSRERNVRPSISTKKMDPNIKHDKSSTTFTSHETKFFHRETLAAGGPN